MSEATITESPAAESSIADVDGPVAPVDAPPEPSDGPTPAPPQPQVQFLSEKLADAVSGSADGPVDESQGAVDGPESSDVGSDATPAVEGPVQAPVGPAVDVVALADGLRDAVAQAWPAWADHQGTPEWYAFRDTTATITNELDRIANPVDLMTNVQEHTRRRIEAHRAATANDPMRVHVRQAVRAAELERVAAGLERASGDESAPAGVRRRAAKDAPAARAAADVAAWELKHTGALDAFTAALAAPAGPPPEPPAGREEETTHRPASPVVTGRW